MLVAQSVQIYNELRPHLSLRMKTPNQVHRKARCKKATGLTKTVNVF